MRRLLILLALAPSLGGCDLALGLGDFTAAQPTPTGDAGGTGGVGGTGGSGGTSQGGTGGEAGSGGAGCPVSWGRPLVGAAIDDGASVATVALDRNNGAVVAAGGFSGTVRLGDENHTALGGQDLFITKHSATGQFLWGYAFGSGGPLLHKRSKDLVLDGLGNITWFGDYQGGFSLGGAFLPSLGQSRANFIAGFTPELGHLWSVGHMGSSTIVAKSIVATGTAGYVVTGHVAGPFDFGGDPLPYAGKADIYVQGLNAVGEHLWVVQFGGPEDDESWSLARDSDGNLWVAARCGENVNILGQTTTPGGDYDACLVKLSPSGGYLWHGVWGDDQYQEATAVAVSSEGVFVAGTFKGTMTIPGAASLVAGQDRSLYVARLDLDGNTQWATSLACSGPCYAGDLVLDGVNHAVLAATFAGTVSLGTEPVAAEGSTDSLVWWLDVESGGTAHHYASGWDGDDGASSLVIDATSRVTLGGVFTGTVNLCSGDTLDAGDAKGAYLLQLAP